MNNATTSTETPMLRPPRPEDYPTLKRLAFMSTGTYEDQTDVMLRGLCKGSGKSPTTLKGTRGSQPITLQVHHRLTVAEYKGKAAGVSYVGNPVTWMQRLTDWRVSELTPMVPMINEVQMLAVEPRYRRRGLARALLDAAEEDLRETGHRLAMVCLMGSSSKHAQLTDWYRRCGYTFSRGTWSDYDPSDTTTWNLWRVQPRTTDPRSFAFTRSGMPGYATGFKALHPAVSITPDTDATPATITGLMDGV